MSNPIVIPAEVEFIIDPYFGFSGIIGSRSMIEAEGIMIDGAKWPKGFNPVCWQDEKFDYWLCRSRPSGAKGPRKSFIEVDWFCLRISLIERLSHADMEIVRQEQQHKEAIYRQSPRGQDEFREQCKAMNAAINDDRFQAFKALIPGLIMPKRGRKPKGKQEAKADSK